MQTSKRLFVAIDFHIRFSKQILHIRFDAIIICVRF